MRNLVTTKTICEKISVSVRTLARWRSLGMPFIKVSRTSVRYDLDAVMEWLKTKHERESGAGTK